MADRLIATPPPHLKAGNTVSEAMRDVIIALIPVSLASIYFYHYYAAFLLVLCMGTAAITEIVVRAALKKRHTLGDLSAVLTGLFVALLMSPGSPWWTAVLATILAVGVAKELMGGLGWNLFNPALFGSVATIILAPWFGFLSRDLSGLNVNFGPIDAISQATPRAMLMQGASLPDYGTMLLGFPGGALSETSPLLVIIGGAFLLYRGHINWRIPVAMIGTVAVLSLLAGGDVIYEMLTGGLMLGAFFMATDWVTSPINNKGKWVFGIAIGALVAVFRFGVGATEGVAFSILIMNAFVPLIERLTKHPSFSEPAPKPATEDA